MSSSSPCSVFSLCIIALCLLSTSEGFGTGTTPSSKQQQQPAVENSRRAFLSNTLATATAVVTTTTIPQLANARYVLNEETGDYDEVTDEDWQTTWKKRLEKAQSMGTEDVFLAAQGAGNLDLKEGMDESDASKKRRAMAGCRNDNLRAKSGESDVKVCTKRVLSGDFQFMIDAM
jgi:preprotein translocase subunit SecG